MIQVTSTSKRSPAHTHARAHTHTHTRAPSVLLENGVEGLIACELVGVSPVNQYYLVLLFPGEPTVCVSVLNQDLP